jgi:activator of HSP90 ATPase
MEHSGAFKSMSVQHKPAAIDPRAGSAFSLFGGYITGRFVEIVPDQLMVQAWRVGGWQPGIYSLARFELREREGRTTVALDHTGFPVGEADHLASGWYANYWNPLHALLG